LKTHASTVSVGESSELLASGTETVALVPLKASAPPFLPVVQAAPDNDPVLLYPDASVAAPPEPSSNA
jgi:hypothetical protein